MLLLGDRFAPISGADRVRSVLAQNVAADIVLKRQHLGPFSHALISVLLCANLYTMTTNSAPVVPIYTIGYGSRTRAIRCRIARTTSDTCGCAHRSYSRFGPESQAALEAALQNAGIRYVYMGDTLGGLPADPDCYTDGKVDYEKVKTKEFYRQGIDRIRTAFEQQQSVVLMCSEGKPEQCHRSKLIAVSLLDIGVAVAHIDENDQIKHQDEVIFALTGGQLDLFGGPAFTSQTQAGVPRKTNDDA